MYTVEIKTYFSFEEILKQLRDQIRDNYKKENNDNCDDPELLELLIHQGAIERARELFTKDRSYSTPMTHNQISPEIKVMLYKKFLYENSFRESIDLSKVKNQTD